MRVVGLVLVVIGLAIWSVQEFSFQHVDAVAGLIQKSLFPPLVHIVLMGGVVLLGLHYFYLFVRRVFCR